MPHVSVSLIPVDRNSRKIQLVERIVNDIVSLMNCGEESVSVIIEEIGPRDWAEKVYRPEILGNWEKLYKKPGCDPFES